MRWVGYVVASVLFGLLAPKAAFAHDEVVGISPSNGEEVTVLPRQVRIELGEQPRSGSGSITGPGGQELRRGKVEVDGTALVIPVRPTTRLGTYTVEFRAASRDGHPTVGSLTFELIPQPSSLPTPTGESPEPANPDGQAGPAAAGVADGLLTWLSAGLAGLAGVAVIGVVTARARSRRRSL